MNFIDEQNSGDNFCFSFFSPFGNFLIDLISNFLFNFPSVSRKKGQKSLGSGIYNVDFVQSNSMNYFFSFFDFSFGTLNKSGLGTQSVVFRSSGKRSPGFGNSTRCFVNGNNISCYNFFFLNTLDHFLP